ncbi:MAG: peptidase domain-containing ABC transporter [Bacteroidales bacterium]|nr:peptidase domain-containing ABC transporter [Bacteroidales bacterium]
MPRFPIFIQHDSNDCGPACLKMIARYYGKNFSLEDLRSKSYITRLGVSLLGISEAAESVGFRTNGVKVSFPQLKDHLVLPCIVHWNQEHFVVVYKIKKDKIYVADPAFGKTVYSKKEFMDSWASTIEGEERLGICLQLETTPAFYTAEETEVHKEKLRFLLKYLKGYKKLIFQIFLGIIFGAILQVIFPFLFQTLVDQGIVIPNPPLIYTILIAQIILVTSRFFVEYIRNWIILHLGARINIYLVSDFLIKLMRLPVAFFDSKNQGDLLQRISDHKRIELFLTSTTINLFHSAFTIVLMGVVLAIFSIKIFLIFFIGSLLYLFWTLQFMKKRKELDNKKFAQLSSNQSNLIQLLTGMHEIKLNRCEKRKRWEWEDIQAKIFRINVNGLSLLQKQRAGALIFNEYKDVLIVFYAALMVLNGNMTFGSIVAISYVVGQLSGPIDQLIDFFHTTQDARISMGRMAEIHKKENEEDIQTSFITELEEKRDINIKKVSFQYEGPQSPYVLKDIEFSVPGDKITAIVGTSGSGKTTLLKLLLSFYQPVKGEISVGDHSLQHFSPSFWRSNCGVVMQDGYLFSESIARNIALSDEEIDKEKLYFAARLANVHGIIEKLPLGFNTKIGQEGYGLSQGQKQRILIARAIYKDPAFLFFDEATNALDAKNELIIMNNLNEYFKGRTVIIVAHRLSTVKNADLIVVLDEGIMVEKGTHAELTRRKGVYYNLVKNQLELGA